MAVNGHDCRLDRDGLLRGLRLLPASVDSLIITSEQRHEPEPWKATKAAFVTKAFALDAELVDAFPGELTTLIVDNLWIEDSGAEALGPVLRRATHIELTAAAVRDRHLTTIAAHLDPGHLEELGLSRNSLKDDGVASVLRGQSQLRRLDLSENSLLDVEAFSGCGLAKLQSLDLSSNRLIDDPMPILRDRAPNLESVDLADNRLDRRAVRALRADERVGALGGNPGARTWRTFGAALMAFVVFNVLGLVNDAWHFGVRLGAGLGAAVALGGIAQLARRRDDRLELRRRMELRGEAHG